MIDFAAAESVLNREVTRLEALSNLRDGLRAIGTLSQAAEEAGKRLDAARAAEAAAQSDLEKIQQRVDAAKAAAATEIADAQAAAELVRSKANDDGAKIIAAARTQAAQIVADAERRTADARARAKVLADAIQQAGN